MNDMFQDLFVDIFSKILVWQEEIIIGFIAIAAFFILGWLWDLEKA
jgi:hypothetical protein